MVVKELFGTFTSDFKPLAI